MANKEPKKELTKTITIRMPLDLYARLDATRRQETRNMTEQIIHSLKGALDELDIESNSESKKVVTEEEDKLAESE